MYLHRTRYGHDGNAPCSNAGVDTRKVQELLGRRAREDDANLQPGGLLMPTETYQQLLIETVLQPPRN